jgi:hypothetical protein
MNPSKSSQLHRKNDLIQQQTTCITVSTTTILDEGQTTENMYHKFTVTFLDEGQCAYQSVGAGVPELNVRRVEPDSNVPTIGSPANASNRTAVLVDGHKLRCGSARCVPQVHRVAQSNGQHVVAPPVKQVEVVVINELRRVQSPLSRLHNSIQAASAITIPVPLHPSHQSRD